METIVIGIVKMIGTSEAQTDWNIIMRPPSWPC
jgi:hypothetical protein